MTQKFTSNARSRLVGALSSSATSFTIEAPTADLFPVANTANWLSPADWFKATLENSLGQVEIVRVGVRALGSGLLSNVLRAQDGTDPIAFDAGAVVGLRITAADVENALAGVLQQLAVTLNASVGGNLAVAGAASIVGKLSHGGVDSRMVPVGGIIMYDGEIADIPAGFQLCDGTNGTPDLRDRFIIGARQDSGGQAMTNVTGALSKSGGSKDAIVVAHSHTGTTGTESANHSHPVTVSGATITGQINFRESGPVSATGMAGPTDSSTNFDGGGAYGGTRGVSLNASHGHTANAGNQTANHNHSFTTGSTGAAGTNANLPPYYALAFIKCMPYAP